MTADLFPVDINKASKFQLLRVPGLDDITASRILEQRKAAFPAIRMIGDAACARRFNAILPAPYKGSSRK